MEIQALSCPKCGGALDLSNGTGIIQCPYCGSTLSVSTTITEKKIQLYNKGTQFRLNRCYSKAEEIFEKIIEEDPKDIDAKWYALLSRYGIEYVKEKHSETRVPTCHRISTIPINDDPDFKGILEYANDEQKEYYINEAKSISEIINKILAQLPDLEPYDVFISYKESDDNGNRTNDSVEAYELYKYLNDNNYNVFFSRITLNDKAAGKDYEAVIYNALHTSKVLLLVGSSKEYMESPWVENEWGRFLSFNEGKMNDHILVPCYFDMDPSELPDKIKNIQGFNLKTVGVYQDIYELVKKFVSKGSNNQPTENVQTVYVNRELTCKDYCDRAKESLILDRYTDALNNAKLAMAKDQNNPIPYLFILLSQNNCKNLDQLVRTFKGNLENDPMYKKCLSLADEKLKKDLEDAVVKIKERKKKKVITGLVTFAVIVIAFVLLIAGIAIFSSVQKKANSVNYYVESVEEISEDDLMSYKTLADNIVRDYQTSSNHETFHYNDRMVHYDYLGYCFGNGDGYNHLYFVYQLMFSHIKENDDGVTASQTDYIYYYVSFDSIAVLNNGKMVVQGNPSGSPVADVVDLSQYEDIYFSLAGGTSPEYRYYGYLSYDELINKLENENTRIINYVDESLIKDDSKHYLITGSTKVDIRADDYYTDDGESWLEAYTFRVGNGDPYYSCLDLKVDEGYDTLSFKYTNYTESFWDNTKCNVSIIDIDTGEEIAKCDSVKFNATKEAIVDISGYQNIRILFDANGELAYSFVKDITVEKSSDNVEAGNVEENVEE